MFAYRKKSTVGAGRAGGARKKAAFIRELVEKARAAELLQMINQAAAELTDADRAARERLVDEFAIR